MILFPPLRGGAVLTMPLGLSLLAALPHMPLLEAAEPPEVRPITPLRKSDSGVAGRFAHLRGPDVGMPFVSEFQPDHPQGHLYRLGFACGGVAIGDVDGDGWPDVFVSGGVGPNALFRHTGEGLRFEEITSRSEGLDGGKAWSAGVAMADVDGDGDLDLYECRYAEPNALWINDGTGRFENRASEWQVDLTDASHSVAFADYDRDGDLDCYLVTNRWEDPVVLRGSELIDLVNGRPVVKPEFRKHYVVWFEDAENWAVEAVGTDDRLLRNDGGRFTEVTKQAGLTGRGDGLAANWWDFDQDGWPDLHVSNDFVAENKLYRNNRDGTFTNVAAEAFPHTPWFSMGADSGDLNGDGRPDLVVADMSATTHFKQKTTMGAMGGRMLDRANTSSPPQYMRNAFFVHTGGPRFLEAAYLAGLDSTDWTWAVKLVDFDGDGRRDVFFTNGTPRAMNDSDLTPVPEQVSKKHEWEYIKNFPERRERNLAYRNEGELRFRPVGAEWNLDYDGVSYPAAAGDLDRDGDPDLVVLNVGEQLSVFRNDLGGAGRAVIRLRGTKSNRFGTGAEILLTAGGRTQTFQLFPERGYTSGDEPAVLAGLGEAAHLDRLEVRWPSGVVQSLENLPANHEVVVTEPVEGGTPAREVFPAPPRETPLWRKVETFRLAAHKESEFDDFALQPLLPNRLSALGPGAACGDVNGDGLEDLFLGGAAGHRGELRLNRGEGRFDPVWVSALAKDKAAEDMGAVFLDAERDGDLDLFVSSGSYEFETGDPLLRDRLYLNDGSGKFAAAPGECLPDLRVSAGPVSAADYDRDGDLDLFVGGRVVPGAYPTSPRSVLLRNESEPGGSPRFLDATASAAPALASCGMVTAALWSDVNDDGWIDLLIATEWGPVRLFRNAKGTLTEATGEAGLAGATGWWNSLASGDFDADGDLDYLAGNTGLNTKYHASADHPVRIFYGDYHGDGVRRIVEAEYEDGVLYPIRGKSCSTRAMPELADKFSTYRAFARATLPEIYGNALEEALELEVTTLESSLLRNDGAGRFTVEPLPRLAQISPVFGIETGDFNNDGRVDAALLQNFFGPQEETGHFDGGMGVILLSDASGLLHATKPLESGFVVTGDGTALVSVPLGREEPPALLAFENQGRPSLFAPEAGRKGSLTLRLRGPAGNPTAVGARVAFQSPGLPRQTAEITAGSGYLSQRAPCLAFTTSTGASEGGVSKITVRWPDGETSEHELDPGEGAKSAAVTFDHPQLANRKGPSVKNP